MISRSPLYEELGRLNNELVNMQRETFKKSIEMSRLAAIVESSSEAICSADLDGAFVSWNASAERLYGYTKSQALGRRATALSLPWPADLVPEVLARLGRGDLIETNEVAYALRDGSRRDVSLTFSPLRDSQGALSGISCFGRDITARKQLDEALQKANAELEAANHRLQTLATQDGLTGLSNHRAFQERLEAEARRSSRYCQPLSLVMLDVDLFKSYNDTYGHPEGDAVLKRVALLLQSGVRDTDLASRYGGEEFALILTQTDRNDALSTAERIRAAIASAPWESRAITVSIGVCSLSMNAADPAALVACADQALYRSKKEGKNRVTYASHMAVEELGAR